MSTVKVYPRNPPANARSWGLTLYYGGALWGYSYRAPIDQPISFLSLPSDWPFPSAVELFAWPNLSPTAGEVALVYFQSVLPGAFGYYPVFISSFGEYDFDFPQLAFIPRGQVVPTLAGRIDQVLYWFAGLAGWQNLNPVAPPVAPQSTAFYLGVPWINSSTVNMKGRVDLEITRPDGSKESPQASSGQDLVASPNNGWVVVFNPCTLGQVGTYAGRVVLSGEAA